MKNTLITLTALTFVALTAQARVKLVAIPERAATIIRLENPNNTLIEEERVLTLQKGLNKIDFSWKGVQINIDSIRLNVLSHPKKVRLLNVSYPPAEAALIWEIYADQAYEETVRISYLLSYIDRLVTYKGVANKAETKLNLKSYLILRNFSGEDFGKSQVVLNDNNAFEQGLKHQETKRLLFSKELNLDIKKVWTFDARTMQWDPEKVRNNVGIPVSYHIANDKKAYTKGKVRIFQKDGHGSTIFLGEDYTPDVSIGENLKIKIGKSRDLVVTQRKMKSQRTNLIKNHKGKIILYDIEETIEAKIQNFKNKPATLTMIQEINGEWEMLNCNEKFIKKDYKTLEFKIELKPNETKTLNMHYLMKNIKIK